MNPQPASADALDQIKAAFHSDNAAEVRRLLDAHPDMKALVNEPIGPFETPAIVNVKSREMLDVLLDYGADINARSTWWAGGFGLLDSATPELSAYALTRGATLTPHAAARLGMLDELKQMVAADPEVVHARGGDGQTPLHFASTVEIAALLLDSGADIDAQDVDHVSTPAQYMVADRQHIARFLVSRGCKADLLMAAALGDVDLARRLLDADPACIRTSVSDEYFPMIGGQNGGTIYQWTLGWYVRAHQVARKFGHPDILDLLLERSPAAVKLVDACWEHDGDAVQRILAEAPAVRDELTDEDRRHVAHAARNNDTEAVRLMLQCGLPVDATSQHRATPLHWAAWHGNRDMAEFLLQHSPPLDLRDGDHDGTPLGWAIYGSEHGWNCRTGDYAGTVEALIRAGAKLPDAVSGGSAVQEVLRRHGVGSS